MKSPAKLSLWITVVFAIGVISVLSLYLFSAARSKLYSEWLPVPGKFNHVSGHAFFNAGTKYSLKFYYADGDFNKSSSINCIFEIEAKYNGRLKFHHLTKRVNSIGTMEAQNILILESDEWTFPASSDYDFSVKNVSCGDALTNGGMFRLAPSKVKVTLFPTL